MDIGIDVGGTNLKAGLVDETGKIVAVSRVPLGEFQGAEIFVHTLVQLVKTCVREAGISAGDVESVGMGIPGAVKDGKIIYTANIPMENVPVQELFQKELNLPVFLGNDADCAAVGEYFCGSGRETTNFIVVTLGTGVGGGLILNRKLFTGMGCGGEIGHIVVERNGDLCNCGRRGCWERYASATGLIHMTQAAMEQKPNSLLHQMAKKNGCVDGRTSFQAAQMGDAAAKAVCTEYVEYLALGITNLVNILQPEKIAIGGGVAGAPEELLLKPLQALVQKECYARHGGLYTQIVKAQLGNDAGIIGAALLRKAV
ncbi:MAG: ROK family protein [Oscillibacter sp.]|nr:ROK family protein [Oscillibacter sp.]